MHYKDYRTEDHVVWLDRTLFDVDKAETSNTSCQYDNISSE